MDNIIRMIKKPRIRRTDKVLQTKTRRSRKTETGNWILEEWDQSAGEWKQAYVTCSAVRAFEWMQEGKK